MREGYTDSASTVRDRRTNILAVGSLAIAAFLLLCATAAPAFTLDSLPDSNVTVLVFNFRKVQAKTLVAAENEASRILLRAGLSVTWRDCPIGTEPCRIGPSRVLFLSMSADPAQDKFLDTVAGYALLQKHIAVVYYDDLPRVPHGDDNERNEALLLGCVITHELGHLLLGAYGHSASGVMQAAWGVQQVQSALRSQLSFLPEEVNLMHSGKLRLESTNSSSIALTSQ